MKKKIIALSVATLVLFGGVASVAIAETPTTVPPGRTPSSNPEHHERHPAIRAAIRALEHAKKELQAADHDFGGHRAEALAECDKAIEQLKLALQYDKK
jgi:hypothetical protein